MEKYGAHRCPQCGAPRSSANPGTICFACQVKQRDAVVGKDKLHYDVQGMMAILGLNSPEQVRRLGRAGRIPGRVPAVKTHLYLKEVVDKWIKADDSYFQPSNDPLLEEAVAMCRRGDHSFFDDERLDGHGYVKETTTSGGPYVITVLSKKTCRFCRFQETSPI